MRLAAIPATFAFVAPVRRGGFDERRRHSVSGLRYAAVIACRRATCWRIGGAKAANGRWWSNSELESAAKQLMTFSTFRPGSLKRSPALCP